MKVLWFLLWIPAVVVFYLSIHDEVLRERALRGHAPDSSPRHHGPHPAH